MVLKGGGQIAQHRIVFGRQRHEVGRIGGHDPVLAPVQIVKRNIHVQCGADVQPDGEAVQLAHDNVFQAAAHKLFAGAKNFRADKPGHVVDMNPLRRGASRLLLGFGNLFFEQPGEAVFARFVNDHVGALTAAVGEVGALSGFKIKSVQACSLRCVGQHLFQRNVECGVGFVAARQTLKPHAGCTRLPFFHFRLNVNVRQNTVRENVFEPEGAADIGKRRLQGGNGFRKTADRVGSEDHIAGRIRPAGKDLPDYIIRVIGGRIGLNAGAHVASGADPGSGQRVEDFPSHGRKIFIGHELHDAADRVAAQAVEDGMNIGLGRREQKRLQLAQGHGTAFPDGVGGKILDQAGVQVVLK